MRRLPVPAWIALAGLALAAVPFLQVAKFYESFLYLTFFWIVMATSWNVLSGYSGYFSFGHGAFFGAGMYTTATLAEKLAVPFLVTVPAAAAVAALLGTAVGLVVFRVRRLRGELFALLTLAVTFVLATVILNTPIDGGPGVSLAGVAVPAIMSSPVSTFYVLALAMAVATLSIAYAVQRSKLGTGLFAIHDDEDAAEVMGVPTLRYKLAAFALSCALAGAAGGIHAMFVSYVTVSETFGVMIPLSVVLMSVLGGSRHWLGPALGAVVITALLYAFTAGDNPVAGRAMVGVVLIAVILFLPRGLLGRLALVSNRRSSEAAAQRIAAEAGRPIGEGGAQGADSRAAQAAARADQRVAQEADRREAAAEPAAAGARLRVVDSKTAPAATTAVGPGLARIGVEPADPEEPPLLAVRGVSKAFSGLRALQEVDLDVRRGEILGLVGPNGSGKSTMINVISGHYRPNAGSIVFGGAELAGLDAHRIARSGIARTYQIPRPFANLTVLQNVSLAARFGHASLGAHEADAEALQWLQFTALAGKAHVLPDELNLHQRKFLELARALASRPKLVLLDEVLSGLTPSEIDGAIRTIRAIRDRGATIVFVEHVMRAVMELTDRIVVLNQGRVIAEGRPDEVMRRDDVVTAYLGRPRAA